MSTAKTDLLEKIHELMAQEMLRKLESGEAEAKDWAVIVKFLKDNNIDAIPSGLDGADDMLTKLMNKAQESIGKYQ